MRLKIHPPTKARGSVKCTIHNNGKLGFSQEAVKVMGIANSSYIQIATDEEDPDSRNLFFIVLNEKKDDAHKIIKAGSYYYLNTTRLFEEFDIDYKNKKVIFDLSEMHYEGMQVFKGTRRVIGRKKK